MLIAPATAEAGLVAAAGLLFGFATGIERAMRRGRSMRCRCFGWTSSTLGHVTAIRNAALGTLAAGTAATGILSGPTPAVPPAAAALAVFGGLVAAVLAIAFDDVVDLLAPARPRRGRS